MPLYEALARYSYLRAYREVDSTPDIERFLTRVIGIGEIALGYKDATFVRLGTSLEEELDDLPEHLGKNIAALTVYPATRLRVTLFERFAPPEPKVNRLFSRVLERVTDHEVGNATLSLTSSRIEVSNTPEFVGQGEECALVLDAGNCTDTLINNAKTLHDYVASTGPGSEIAGHYQSLEALSVPFGRLPRNATPEQKEDFQNRASRQLPAHGLEITVGPIEWDAKIRPPLRKH